MVHIPYAGHFTQVGGFIIGLPLVFKLISIFWPSDFVMFFLQREVVAGTLIIGGAIILRQFFIGIRSAIAIIVLLVVGSVFIAHLLF